MSRAGPRSGGRSAARRPPSAASIMTASRAAAAPSTVTLRCRPHADSASTRSPSTRSAIAIVRAAAKAGSRRRIPGRSRRIRRVEVLRDPRAILLEQPCGAGRRGSAIDALRGAAQAREIAVDEAGIEPARRGTPRRGRAQRGTRHWCAARRRGALERAGEPVERLRRASAHARSPWRSSDRSKAMTRCRSRRRCRRGCPRLREIAARPAGRSTAGSRAPDLRHKAAPRPHGR